MLGRDRSAELGAMAARTDDINSKTTGRSLITRVLTTVRGGTAPVLPLRVREDVARQQDRSEQIISVVQIVIVLLFGGLFLVAPGPGDVGVDGG
jgi:hypothetical protein